MTDTRARQAAAGPDDAMNDAIEAYARRVGCQRHAVQLRACRWDGGKPCHCRAALAPPPASDGGEA